MQEDKLILILEDMRSDFRAFKEGLSLVRDELREFKGEMREEMHEFKEEMRGMTRFLQDMMSEHEKWLQDHDVRIRVLEKKIA